MTSKPVFAALFAIAILTWPISPGFAQGGACLTDRDIQSSVAAGKILPLNRVLASAGLGDVKVLPPVKVCKQGGQLSYIISILQGGQAKTISLNATGRP